MTADAMLDPDEQELLDSYERDEWRSVNEVHEQIHRYQAHATAVLESAGLVSIVLPPEDIKAIRQAATQAGKSYQAFIADIVRQYVADRIVPKSHAR